MSQYECVRKIAMQEWENQKNKLLFFVLTDAKWIDQFYVTGLLCFAIK